MEVPDLATVIDRGNYHPAPIPAADFLERFLSALRRPLTADELVLAYTLEQFAWERDCYRQLLRQALAQLAGGLS